MSAEPLVAQNPDFAAVTTKFIMDMPIAAFFGFSLTRLEPGLLEVTQPYRPELCFTGRLFQAGPIGMLADFAGAGACFSMLPPGWLAATADYTVKLLAPAEGDALVARGRVVQYGRTLSVAASEVFAVTGGREILCATALVTARNFAAR